MLKYVRGNKAKNKLPVFLNCPRMIGYIKKALYDLPYSALIFVELSGVPPQADKLLLPSSLVELPAPSPPYIFNK